MKLKQIVVLLLVTLLCVGFAACSKDGAPKGTINVAVDDAKFYLYVPDNWVSLAGGGISGATTPGREGANVQVVTYLAGQDYGTAANYWDTECAPVYAATFTDFTLDEALCGDTALGGVNARNYVYTATLGGETYRFRQVIALYHNMVYILTFTASPDVYEIYAEDVDAICGNFVFR